MTEIPEYPTTYSVGQQIKEALEESPSTTTIKIPIGPYNQKTYQNFSIVWATQAVEREFPEYHIRDALCRSWDGGAELLLTLEREDTETEPEWQKVTTQRELQQGDDVRVTNGDGDVMHGTYDQWGRVGVVGAAYTLDPEILWEAGYTIERWAVPSAEVVEEADPLEAYPAGLYVHREAYEEIVWKDSAPAVLINDGEGEWIREDYRDARADALAWHKEGSLARLTLEANADMLQGRLDAARAYVEDPGNWSTLDGRRRRILDLLDGTFDA